MRLILHPKVYSDVSKIMEYYEEVATSELADAFYKELRDFANQAAEKPESFSVRERGLRRANLRSFPITFCFVS